MTTLHAAMGGRKQVEEAVLDALGGLLEVFARRTLLVVSGRAADGGSVRIDGRTLLARALDGARVIPTDASIRTTHVATWEGPGAQLSLQIWREQPWLLTCDLVWEDRATLAEDLAGSLIGPFDFVSVGVGHRAKSLPRIGDCVFVAKHVAVAYRKAWGHGEDLDNAVRFRFVQGSDSFLSTREAERRALEAQLPTITIPRLQDVLALERRSSNEVDEPSGSLPTYLRHPKAVAPAGCCASSEDDALGTRPSSISAPVHAATEEIDFEAVRRLVGKELPDGFTNLSDDAAAEGEGPRTIRTPEGTPPARRREYVETVLLRASQEDEGSGTVLARPSREVLAARAAFGQMLTPVRVPELTVDQYAELVATLEVGGATDVATWRRFGIFSAESKRALDDLFSKAFTENPAEHERFQAWLVHHRDRLRRERGPR